MAAAGQGVHPPLSPGLCRRPTTGKEACLLETMKRRINRSFRQIEGLAALALDRLDYGVAVSRARRQSSQHNQVEVAFEHFSFHTFERYVSPIEPSSSGKMRLPKHEWHPSDA